MGVQVSPRKSQLQDFCHSGSPFWPFLQRHLTFFFCPPFWKSLSPMTSWSDDLPQKNWVTGRFFMKIVCETALVSVSSLEISGHVMHGENFECDQVLSAWHLIRHRPRERHPIGQTAAQYAPEHFTSRPFSGTGGLLPQSCHCLFDLTVGS